MSTTADWIERATEAEKECLELKEQVANLHSFLDEVWLTYKLNTALRQRILLAKARRWDQALLGVTLTEADYELIRQGSNAYEDPNSAEAVRIAKREQRLANRTVNPGTEHTEALALQETGETFGI